MRTVLRSVTPLCCATSTNLNGVQIRVDEGEPVALKYTLCYGTSCQAETELTKELFESMRNGKQLEIVESFDPVQQRLKGQWILINQDGTREPLSPYKHIVYTYDRFAEICREVGCDRVAGYGDWQGSPVL
jgi:hypothetical protein